MVRNVIGSILALLGATAAVWSPFRAWYDGRHGRDYRIADLFGGITQAKPDIWASLLLPFAFAALVTLVGLLLRSRVLVAVAGLVVLGFTILWMVRQGQATGSLSVESDGSGLGQGVGLAAGGGVLLLLGAVLMSGRRHVEHEPHEPGGLGRRRRHGRHEEPERYEEPYAEHEPHERRGLGRFRRHGRHEEPDRHEEPYAEPYQQPQGEPYAEPHGQSYGQRPYADDTRTAEYPRYDDRPGDGPGGPGPGQGGRG
ncbi:hypothetical protein [Streptomyces sp. NPDC000229]|uniref:hypothetical protein n=1 Tax=Streptomyces sp. NPDC000229 TaxID=3154247 RepID=UPI00332D7FF4